MAEGPHGVFPLCGNGVPIRPPIPKLLSGMDAFHDRKHPHRLDPDMYHLLDEMVFITFCAHWHRSLAEEGTARQLVEVMGRMASKRGLRIHAYCVMPDHVHVVVSVQREGGDIEGWLRFAKREAAAVLSAPGMWERSYWDRHARKHEDVKAMVEYVLANPVRRGLCERWCDWPYSWSEWHEEAKGSDPNGLRRRRGERKRG